MQEGRLIPRPAIHPPFDHPQGLIDPYAVPRSQRSPCRGIRTERWHRQTASLRAWHHSSRRAYTRTHCCATAGKIHTRTPGRQHKPSEITLLLLVFSLETATEP
ncbi:unnamed protein product [Ectocarpus sp. 12 AP-2014]